MKVVFISGPYSGVNAWDVEKNVRACEELVLQVASMGVAPICLNVMGRFFNGTLVHSAWLNVALEQLRRSDALLLANGWQWSHGCGVEHKLALELGKPIFEQRDTLVPLMKWVQHGTLP